LGDLGKGERGWVEGRAGGQGHHSAAMLSQQPWLADFLILT